MIVGYICGVKKCLVILLATLFLSLSCKDLFTHLSFAIHQEYITDNFCININEPEILCSGKCYLGDSIQKNQEQKKEIPSGNSDQKTQLIADVSSFMISYPGSFPQSENLDHINVFHTLDFSSNLLDPPRFS